MKNIYVVKKYIVAESIEEALIKEKETHPVECWLDGHSAKELKDQLIKSE